ncbi:MAG: hypothetical protein IKW67_02765 [Alphaproteobacteria bacterium]|nr:hypothetical protein [Alphaproteobacteria bacterium]
MAKIDKKSLKQQIEFADNAKKANVLDLSADQDLSIALMNLLMLERYATEFGYADIFSNVFDLRQKLIMQILKDSSNVDIAARLLTAAVIKMSNAIKLMDDGENDAAYAEFDMSYELYSMFWGINMGLIELDVVKKCLD